MKISMIFNSTLPTKRAHGFQIVKMCETFAKLGAVVNLFIPAYKNEEKLDIYDFYKIEKNFSLKKRWSPKISNRHRVKYFIFLLRSLFFKIPKDNYIFTRHPEMAFLLSLFGYKIIFELHNWYEQRIWLKIFFIKKVFLLISTTNSIKDELIKAGFNEKKVLVAPHGVDVSSYDVKISRDEARRKCDIPLDKKIIIYTGTLSKQKGVYDLVESAKYLSDDYRIVIVGGLQVEINKIKKISCKYNNVDIVGYKSHDKIPYYLKSADVLVIANRKDDVTENKYTAPLKLFEYLASGVPILASNVESIHEFLNNKNANFFKPGDAKDLAKKIKGIIENKEKQKEKINNALNMAKGMTWEKRAEKIIKYIIQYESH